MIDSINNLFNIEGQAAIVTGGKRGIGYEAAKTLYEAGCKVVVIDILNEDDTFQGFDKDRIKYFKYDLSESANIDRAFNEALSFLGRLNILVNCAGINKRFSAEQFPLDTWSEIIQLNLTSVFRLCQMAGNIMLKQGYGKIINIASLLSFNGGYTASAYSASKGGIAQLTKSLSNEWAKKNVNVNALAPGMILTELNTEIINDESRYSNFLSRIPANRWGRTDDLSGSLLFLSSSASDYVHGIILPVDGGYLGR
jgi:2-dehydro-3-deoxy-D-gluconate 5-dehydrogenase